MFWVSYDDLCKNQPTPPPQTSGIGAGTGQRAMSILMALVCAENGVVKTELLCHKCSPCNDTLLALEVLIHVGASLQKVDVLWPPEFLHTKKPKIKTKMSGLHLRTKQQ